MDEESFGQVRDAVRRFVRERVIPREEEIETADAIPEDLRAAAAEMGLFGYALPEEYGGLAVSMSQDVRLGFEFGYTTPAFRSMFGTNNGIAGQVIAKFGSAGQKQEFLPALAAGDLVASFALTEPEAGSNPAGLRTSARRDGTDWVLSGTACHRRWLPRHRGRVAGRRAVLRRRYRRAVPGGSAHPHPRTPPHSPHGAIGTGRSARSGAPGQRVSGRGGPGRPGRSGRGRR